VHDIYHNIALHTDPPVSYLFYENGESTFISGARYRLYIDNRYHQQNVHIWIDQTDMYFD
jgi:hypothetical protein